MYSIEYSNRAVVAAARNFAAVRCGGSVHIETTNIEGIDNTFEI